MPRTITIRTTMLAALLLATAATASVALGLHYYFSGALARDAALDVYAGASSGVTARLQHVAEQNTGLLALLAENPELVNGAITGARLRSLGVVLERSPLLHGIYLAHEDGRFQQLINLDTGTATRRTLGAAPQDRWLVVDVAGRGEERRRTTRYLDADFGLRIERSEPTTYDPREQAWYEGALAQQGIYRSGAYLLERLEQPGRTVSYPIAGSRTVLGLDMTLQTISAFLGAQAVARSGSLFVFNGDGVVLASSSDIGGSSYRAPPMTFEPSAEERQYLDGIGPLIVSNQRDWPPFDFAVQGHPRGYSIDMVTLLADALGLEIRFVNGLSWAESAERFRAGDIDVLQSLVLTEGNRTWGVATRAYADVPYALATRAGGDGIRTLDGLRGRRLAVPAGWSILPLVRRAHPGIEIVETAGTLGALQAVLAGDADAALDNEAILRHVAGVFFLEGLEFTGDVDPDGTLLPRSLHLMVHEDRLAAILDRAIDGIGTPTRDGLAARWLTDPGQRPAAGGATVPDDVYLRAAADPSLQRSLQPVVRAGEAHLAYVAALTQDEATPLFLGLLVPEAIVVGPSMEKVRISIAITAGVLLLLLPLAWAFSKPIVRPIRQLAAENDKVRRREDDEVRLVPSRIRELSELSDSMVAMVAAIKAHELAHRQLMDSFVQLIAATIDEKSPYTGGHCERVPELAMMLARHASDETRGPFSQFRLETADEWREFRTAAWLHDCGKITTPEHIVDKGSKLETIYNRLHEVRMRFEVLWRDAELHYLESLRQESADADELLAELEAERARLQEEFAFIAECNVGGEFLSPEKQERLGKIASRTWVRHFDDRIGLSPVEALRLDDHAAVPAPAEERLLSDKPEHVIERTRVADYPSEYGIAMDIPARLYNHGELYNLSISRGTLTAEDRFKINEHMISTIRMLESLPFPPELARVPRWASTHHETLRGSGYPRKLKGDQLSIPERLMAIADVFEALTAADRPYKKAKTIGEALAILHRMVEEEHLDRDCFELFVRHRVHVEYGRRFLDPAQIDEVDVARFLS